MERYVAIALWILWPSWSHYSGWLTQCIDNSLIYISRLVPKLGTWVRATRWWVKLKFFFFFTIFQISTNVKGMFIDVWAINTYRKKKVVGFIDKSAVLIEPMMIPKSWTMALHPSLLIHGLSYTISWLRQVCANCDKNNRTINKYFIFFVFVFLYTQGRIMESDRHHIRSSNKIENKLNKILRCCNQGSVNLLIFFFDFFFFNKLLLWEVKGNLQHIDRTGCSHFFMWQAKVLNNMADFNEKV